MAMARASQIRGKIVLAITVFSLSLPAYAKYSGGTGDPSDPYQIATADDLMLLGDSTEDYDKHFIMTADIDLDPNLPGRKVFDKAVISTFVGVFDGNGHTISHLTIVGGDYLGLFGDLGHEAEIKDLGVMEVNITSTGVNVGGLVGENNGSIRGCYTTGLVSGDGNVGGLLGEHRDGSVNQCYSTGTVSGTGEFWANVGGLV